MTSGERTSDRTAIPAVVVGTLTWLVALLVVTVRDGVQIPTDGVWWWGVCAVGTASGLIGIPFLLWRRSRVIRTPTARAASS